MLNVIQASRAIVAFFGMANLPAPAREKLTEALVGGDAVGTIITAMEALYAARADLGAAGIELLDNLARFVGAHNFYGKAGRAAQIAGVTARIAGGGEAEAEGDPEPDRPFAAPEPAQNFKAALLLASEPQPAEEPEA